MRVSKNVQPLTVELRLTASLRRGTLEWKKLRGLVIFRWTYCEIVTLGNVMLISQAFYYLIV
jgi:hypothetical protein